MRISHVVRKLLGLPYGIRSVAVTGQGFVGLVLPDGSVAAQ